MKRLEPVLALGVFVAAFYFVTSHSSVGPRRNARAHELEGGEKSARSGKRARLLAAAREYISNVDGSRSATRAAGAVSSSSAASGASEWIARVISEPDSPSISE